MNVIEELTEVLGDAPVLSHHTRERTKEILMNHIATSHARRHRRRLVGAGVVAVAAAAALVVGVALPARSPLSARPASAAALAIRAVADEQRAVPDTPRDLSDVTPDVAALVPVLSDLPTDGTTADVWSWLDTHCDAASPAIALDGADPEVLDKFRKLMSEKDCGLLSVYAFLQISTPEQTAALLDALASVPNLAAIERKCPSGALAHLRGGTWQDFSVIRNGTVAVLSISRSDQAPADLRVSLVLTLSGKTPC
jgi:hypothetical protein